MNSVGPMLYNNIKCHYNYVNNIVHLYLQQLITMESFYSSLSLTSHY